MKRKRILGSLTLVLVALIWGVAFTAQSEAMKYIEPFTFNTARSLIAGVLLIPVVRLLDVLDRKDPNFVPPTASKRTLLFAGVLCGIILAVASALQQFGVMYTNVGKAGFITALYIVFVPVAGLVFRRRPGILVWIAVIIAVVGMYLLCMTDASFSLQFGDMLCMTESFTIAPGDTLVLLCALGFTAHILVIDRFSQTVDCVRMSMIQFFVCALISGICMIVFERPDIEAVLSAWLPILYAGALSSGVGYTLQIVAQKDTPPVLASLLMSLESVFAVLAGWLILGQTLTAKELCGCGLMFAAIILAQIPKKTDICSTNIKH